MIRPLNFVLAVLLAVSIVSVAPVAADSTTVIGTDSELASDKAGVEFRETGNVSATYAAPEVTVQATQTAEDCGVEREGLAALLGVFSDTRNDFLCLDYAESVTRTFEVYVSQSVWAGYEREEVNPKKGDAHASFESATIDGERYLKVTTTLSEPGMYAFPVNRESTFLAERVDRHRDRVENVTGVGVAETDEWQYVNSEDYSNESTYVLQSPNGTENLLLEYKTEDGWAVVPEGRQSYAPVYYEQVSDTEALVFAVEADDPPRLRYTEDPTTTTMFDSFWREAWEVPSRISDFFSSFGGG